MLIEGYFREIETAGARAMWCRSWARYNVLGERLFIRNALERVRDLGVSRVLHSKSVGWTHRRFANGLDTLKRARANTRGYKAQRGDFTNKIDASNPNHSGFLLRSETESES